MGDLRVFTVTLQVDRYLDKNMIAYCIFLLVYFMFIVAISFEIVNNLSPSPKNNRVVVVFIKFI